jgi:DNA-binding transcriptional MerR regulator
MIEPDTQTAGDHESLYNIGVVSRMTNITEATLRVWERRYHFPRSARTAGGHRLYSQQEIVRLKWVKQRIEEGMQASRAIQALHHFEKEREVGPVPSVPQPSVRVKSGVSMPEYRERLVEALLAYDTEGANLILGEASAAFSLEDLITGVISLVFRDIGEAWHAGRIDVATEHLSTNLLRHHLLGWMRTGPPPFHVNPVILACAPGELHEGSLLMLGVLLRRLRWPVAYLGQSVPLENLAPFVEALQPSAIVFVAMTSETAQALRHWPQHLPHVARTGRPFVGYGGPPYSEQPELAAQTPGVLLGRTLQEGMETLDRLLHAIYPFPR